MTSHMNKLSEQQAALTSKCEIEEAHSFCGGVFSGVPYYLESNSR